MKLNRLNAGRRARPTAPRAFEAGVGPRRRTESEPNVRADFATSCATVPTRTDVARPKPTLAHLRRCALEQAISRGLELPYPCALTQPRRWASVQLRSSRGAA